MKPTKIVRPRPCICAHCGKRIYKYQQAGYCMNRTTGEVKWYHDGCGEGYMKGAGSYDT